MYILCTIKLSVKLLWNHWKQISLAPRTAAFKSAFIFLLYVFFFSVYVLYSI